jgi:hypothetical protein
MLKKGNPVAFFLVEHLENSVTDNFSKTKELIYTTFQSLKLDVPTHIAQEM